MTVTLQARRQLGLYCLVEKVFPEVVPASSKLFE